VAGQRPGDLGRQVEVGDVGRGEVHRDRHVALRPPPAGRVEGQLEDDPGQRAQRTDLFGGGQLVGGESRPRTGCCQRTRASAPTTRPSPRSTCGWRWTSSWPPSSSAVRSSSMVGRLCAGLRRRPDGVRVAAGRGQGEQRHRGQPGEVERSALDVGAGGGEAEVDDVAGPVGRDRGADGQQRALAPDTQHRAHADEQGQQDDVRHRVGEVGERSGHVPLGDLQGRTQQERDRDGARAQGPDDAVEPHAGVEPRDAGADQPMRAT
jgi:hypothetical protein